MDVMIYSSEIGERAKDIRATVEKLFPPDRLDIVRSIDLLSDRLQRIKEGEPVILILICSNEDLIDLVSLRELLHRFRLVLVLPDAEDTTISLAHRLRPNYLTYIHGDPGHLKAVLLKMIEQREAV